MRKYISGKGASVSRGTGVGRGEGMSFTCLEPGQKSWAVARLGRACRLLSLTPLTSFSPPSLAPGYSHMPQTPRALAHAAPLPGALLHRNLHGSLP